MNRITVSIVLAVSSVLFACGNKGELFLETDSAVIEEIKQLDDSLDDLADESATGTDANTVEETEDAIKKAKKNADGSVSNE